MFALDHRAQGPPTNPRQFREVHEGENHRHISGPHFPKALAQGLLISIIGKEGQKAMVELVTSWSEHYFGSATR
jgi:hypothetical protein